MCQYREQAWMYGEGKFDRRQLVCRLCVDTVLCRECVLANARHYEPARCEECMDKVGELIQERYKKLVAKQQKKIQ